MRLMLTEFGNAITATVEEGEYIAEVYGPIVLVIPISTDNRFYLDLQLRGLLDNVEPYQPPT